MKKIKISMIVWMLACVTSTTVMLTACSDEESHFLPGIGSEAFSFEPIAGGAIMRYTLPADPDITGLRIRYKDFKGDEIIRSGSSFCDSLTIVGFNEARQGVEGEVSLCNRQGEESAPIAVHFDTNDSAPYAFFDNVSVKSGWNGFSVFTDNPKNAKGMAHVFYLGIDPMTGAPDTILVNSFTLTEGKDTLIFKLQQESPENTIVIRTEDFRGYMVRQEVYPNIISYNTEKFDASNVDFYCEKTIEQPDHCVGWKYLFDGDMKGLSYFPSRDDEMIYMYAAGPQALQVPMYIDLKENKICAQVRLYAPCYIYRTYGDAWDSDFWFKLVQYNMTPQLPCDVEIYGAKDDGNFGNFDAKQWTKLGSFKQDPQVDEASRWCVDTWGDYQNGYDNIAINAEEAEALDPIYMEVDFGVEGQDEGYRYLKVVVNDVFEIIDEWYGAQYNLAKYVMIQEMEIYTKKD